MCGAKFTANLILCDPTEKSVWKRNLYRSGIMSSFLGLGLQQNGMGRGFLVEVVKMFYN